MDPLLLGILVVLGAVAGFALVGAVRVVPEQGRDLVERLGKYHRTLGPGKHLTVPVVDRVRVRVDLGERVIGPVVHPAVTADHLAASVGLLLHLRVVDPVRATYEIADVDRAVEQLAVTILRQEIGSLDLAQAVTSRGEISRRLADQLAEPAHRWGVRVTRAEVSAIEAPPMRDNQGTVRPGGEVRSPATGELPPTER